MKPVNLTGIAWFRREQYPQLLEIFEDAADLPTAYDDWLARAEKGFQELERRGVSVIRVELDAEEFSLWCASRGLKLDSHARNQFVLNRLAPNR